MRRCAFILAAVGCGAGASAQNMGAAASITPSMDAGEPGGGTVVRAPIVASLTYDGTQTWGLAAQDFESVFDAYDTYCCEIFSIDEDVELTEFRTAGFGSGNPFGMTDVIVEIYRIDDLEDLCDDDDLPAPLMRSVPGAGFYDGTDAVSDFGGRRLRAGEYILRWAAELEFTSFGQFYSFGQHGPHDNGGGTANDGFQSNPGDAFGLGHCIPARGIELLTGVNFVLCGERAGDCPDAGECGDWDDDGDVDSDDFFYFLDEFEADDPCADLDGDGNIDSDDFFAYLERFVRPC